MMDIKEKYMYRALQLAKLGNGAVSPNPMVGAVVVHNDRIIGEGYHRQYGCPHAEVNAINSVADKSLLQDSTIYVTLEPCSHYGKTPPCSELIIKMGIPRVVVGAMDPFAKVCGRGVKMLRDAGVEVATGILEDACRVINKKFITAHTLHRPYVLLKWAQSADGYIDAVRTGRGTQVVMSNAVTSMLTHRERTRYDAILVGARTVAMDNPSLTVRNWNCGQNPVRIVLDGALSMPADSKLLTDGGRTIVYNRTKAETEGAIEYVALDDLFPLNWLSDLYNRGITSLMVEGGANVIMQLIDANEWDAARVEIGRNVIGTGILAPKIKGIITNEEIHYSNIIRQIENGVKML